MPEQSPQPDDDARCLTCGSYDVEWEKCWECHGDGSFDVSEEDPINFAPGEEFEKCEQCDGVGGYLVCRNCQAMAEKRAMEQMPAKE